MKAKEKISSVVAKPKRPKIFAEHKKIEMRAYQIFLDRGATHGQDLADWLQAEKDLLQEFNGQPDRKAKAQKT
jgi:Protein of unknown function (DUF2934)